MERMCRRDVAFRIICAGDGPDHVTISRFRVEAAEVMAELFAQVLMVCARVGMAELGVVAIDSVKIASNASLKANHTAEGLRRAAAAAAAEHAAADAEDDARYGPDGRGDEVAPEVADPRSRAGRIAQALAELSGKDNDHDAGRAAQLEQFRRRREQRAVTPMGLPPAEIRVEVLTQNLAEARAAHKAKIDRYHARGKRGRPPAPVEQAYRVARVQAALDRAIAAGHKDPDAAGPSAPHRRWGEPKRNITDPQSRAMPIRGGGWVQGYNCQAVTSSDGLIITTSVGNNLNDSTAFTATMHQAVAAAALIDAHRPTGMARRGIGVLLGDAGYLSTANLTAEGPDRLIAIGKSRTLALAAAESPTAGPPPTEATPIQAMAHRLRTPQGHALYKQRSHIAETPFAHAKHNLGFRRFTSRGIDRATAEFNFHALVHNLFKAIGTGALALVPS